MGRCAGRILIGTVAVLLLAPIGAAQEDREGCEDYPLLTRLDGFFIDGCKDESFSSHQFTTKDGKIAVEGHFISVSYRRPDSAPEMSGLEMIRNYVNAVEKIGGEVLYEGRYSASMKVVVDDREVWIEVLPYGKRAYRLDIIEKQTMAQQVVADAAALLGDLDTSGHAVLQGIFFDTDTAVITPESTAALNEIAKLFDENPDLTAYVVGHTDMTGSLEHNLDLSQRRAAAVVEALVTQHGISRDRLTARGVGPLAPIGSNDTEAGRALNRRVELVAR
ncbi:MAG: OmpA family protein [Holophagae bacterium]|jgi:outer membrane protein OmpA-like peptidoglycan-associated protein